MCGCGQVETEGDVLFEWYRYGQEGERWRGTIEILKDDMCEYAAIKWCHADSEIEKDTMRYLRVLWNSRPI